MGDHDHDHEDCGLEELRNLIWQAKTEAKKPADQVKILRVLAARFNGARDARHATMGWQHLTQDLSLFIDDHGAFIQNRGAQKLRSATKSSFQFHVGFMRYSISADLSIALTMQLVSSEDVWTMINARLHLVNFCITANISTEIMPSG